MRKAALLFPTSLLCSFVIHYVVFFSVPAGIPSQGKESALEPEAQPTHIALIPNGQERDKKEDQLVPPAQVQKEELVQEDREKPAEEMAAIVDPVPEEEVSKETLEEEEPTEEVDDGDDVESTPECKETDRLVIKISNAVEKWRELNLLPVVFIKNDPRGKYIVNPEQELYQVLSSFEIFKKGYSNVYIELNTREAKERMKYLRRIEFLSTQKELIYGLLFPIPVYNRVESAINSYLESNKPDTKLSHINQVRGEFQGDEFIVIEVLMRDNLRKTT